MTTDHRQSLRGLARRLGVAHSALSQAAAAGRLTAGVDRDARGRLVVVDADAAAAQWAEVSMLPAIRQPPAAAPPVSRPPPLPDPLDVEFYDGHFDRWITGRELLAERHTLCLLVSALATVLLADRDPGTLRTLVAEALPTVAKDHCADAARIASAEDELDTAIVMLTDEDPPAAPETDEP